MVDDEAEGEEEESLVIEMDDDEEEEEMDDDDRSFFPPPATTAAVLAPAAGAVAVGPASAASSSALCRKAGCKWTAREDARLRAGVAAVGECGWEVIAAQYLRGARSAIQCSHRWQKVLRPGLVKGPWTREEDAVIIR